MRAAVVVGACAVLLSPGLPARTAPPPPATLVGVVSDGALTPIVVFDGHDWWNAWPWAAESEEIKALPLPSSLDAVPADWLPPGVRVPRDWRVLRPSGATAPLKVMRPVRAELGQLMDTISLTTTWRARGDGDALAIAGPGVLGTFVTPSRSEVERVVGLLTGRLGAIERDAIERWQQEYKANGIDVDLPLTRVYRAENPGGTGYPTERPTDWSPDYGLSRASDRVAGKTYYQLDGEKLFRIRAGGDCYVNLSTSGLVVVDRRGALLAEKLASSAYAEYCGDAAAWLDPLGTVRIGDRMLWIMRYNVEDGFDYGLFDPALGDQVTLKGEWGLRSNRIPRPLVGLPRPRGTRPSIAIAPR